jgi:hypothetical protein
VGEIVAFSGNVLASEDVRMRDGVVHISLFWE